jgi:SAM-dependent methyltransferase
MGDQSLPKEKQGSPFQEINLCPACSNNEFDRIYDFVIVPLAGYFPLPGKSEERFLIPMELRSCKECQLVQINPDVSDELLFADYRYVSSVGMQSHFDSFANWFEESHLADQNSTILEIGCNDGPLLDSLTKKGYRPIGIDPASNIVRQASQKGLNVICDFFNSESVEAHQLVNTCDVLISCNSFAHISDIHLVAKSVARALKPTGVFIVEIQSLYDLVETKAFDFVYHEHKYYYSIVSISNLLRRHGLYLVDGMEIATHGGSMRLVFSKSKNDESENLKKMIRKDNSVDLSPTAIEIAVASFMDEIQKLKIFLANSSEKNQVCVGVGASGRANMLLNYLLPEAKVIDAVYDESPERIGREMALSEIPVKGLAEASELTPANVLVLAWNYSEVLIDKWPNQKSTFVVPLPEFTVVKKG